MTSIERARQFIQARGKAIALTIVPLAAIAIAASQPVRAANVVTFTPQGCDVVQDGILQQPLADCSTTPIPGFQNNANGLKLSGEASVNASGSGPGSLTFNYYGSANGATPQGSLPLSWDFTVGTNQQIPAAWFPGSYDLEYNLNDGAFIRTESGSLSFDAQCQNNQDLTCAHVTGTDTFPVDGPINSYDITLTISGYFFNSSFLQVTIPNNSIDFNPQAAQVATPEPTSMALGLSGLLGLAFAGFRRRRKV